MHRPMRTTILHVARQAIVKKGSSRSDATEARSLEQNPQNRNRQAHDLDQEDVELHRERAIEEKPGVRASQRRGQS
jgi:hypothetical protein